MGENYFEDRNGRAIRVGDTVKTYRGKVAKVETMRVTEMDVYVTLEGYEGCYQPVHIEVVDPDPSTPQRDEGEGMSDEKLDPEAMCFACLGRDGYHLAGCFSAGIQSLLGKRLDALEERVEGLIGLSPASTAFVQDLPNRVVALEKQHSEDRAVFMGGGFQALVDRVAALEPKPEPESCGECGGQVLDNLSFHTWGCSVMAYQRSGNPNGPPEPGS